MTNLVEVERRFLELQHKLGGNLSFRHQWVLIGDFLTLIKGQFATYDTHCEQLAEQLPVFTHPLSFTGTDPEELESILDLVTEMYQAIPALNKINNAGKAIESLACAVSFLYLCLHKFEVAGTILFGKEKPQLSFPENENPEKYLRAVKDIAEKHDLDSVKSQLKTLAGWFQQNEVQKRNSLYIPVLERIGENRKVGRLRQLTATVLGDCENEDTFRNSYTVVGAESETAGIRKEVTEATRKLLNETHPKLKDRFFKVQFEYAIPMGVHEGRSSELACCITAYSAILDAAQCRERYRPNNKVAVTGCVKNDLRVGKVDAGGLSAKMRAAFFSWMEYLVVPEQQEREFLQQLAILQDKYPSRRLKLISLEEPKAFFYDRRISDHRLDSKTRYLAKKAWQQKSSVAGIVTIIILLAVIGRLWYGPLDKNPVIGKFEGNQLHLYNKQHSKIRSFEVGSWALAYQEKNNSDQAEPQVQFYDINRDGINELFWYQIPQEGISEGHSLIAWSISGDSLIWQTPLSFDINYPKKNSIKGSQYQLREFHIEKYKAGNAKIIANTNLLTFFPALILAFNIETGIAEQRYVHPGYFYDMDLHDVTGDGVAEVIATGVSNAFWKGVISVLELDQIQGHAPTSGDYIVEDFQPADELYYILVPKTILGRYYDPVSKYNSGRRIVTKPSDSLLTFYIDDARAPSFEEAKQPHVILNFNEQFQPVGIGTSDRYDIIARQLYQEGKIPFEPDYEYFEAFKDSLVYLNR